MNPLATQYVQQFVGQRSGYDQEVSDGIFRTAQERQRQFLDRAIKELDSGGVYLILRSPHFLFYSSFVLARLPHSFVRLYQFNLYFSSFTQPISRWVFDSPLISHF